MSSNTEEAPIGRPSPSTDQTNASGRNAAHAVTVRAPNGDIVELSPGWNQIAEKLRVYLRADGTISYATGGSTASAQPPPSSSQRATSTTPEVATPYQPWQRPPFAPGHTLSVKHGAESPRFVDPLAAELVARTVAAAPFLGEASFRPALDAWARAEARCALLAAYLDEHGLLDEHGVPRPATKLMTAQENLALKQRTRLGLDAASRAGIEASLTSSAASQASLEAALDRGAKQIRQRMAQSQTGGQG